MMDKPSLAIASKFIEIMSGMVRADIGPGHPIGAGARSVGAGQFNVAGGEVVTYECRLMRARDVFGWFAPAADPLPDSVAPFIAKQIAVRHTFGFQYRISGENGDEVFFAQPVA